MRTRNAKMKRVATTVRCVPRYGYANTEVRTIELDGVNLLPHLQGEASQPPHDSLYWRFGDQMAIRHGNYKLVKGRGEERPMLFDLAADVGEKHDLTSEQPDVAKDLQARYDAWDATLEKPRWGNPGRQLGTFQNKANKKKGKGKKAKAVD